MHQGSTVLLRGVVWLLGIMVIVLCLFVLPPIIRAELAGNVTYTPLLLGMYIPAFPFFFALYQALKILRFIDQNTAFSKPSVIALKNIKSCALAIGGFYTLGMPYAISLAEKEHALGAALLGGVIIMTSLVVATTTAILQKLLHQAIAIQSENEMTI